VVEALGLVREDAFIVVSVVAVALQFLVWCDLRRGLTFLN
jgi:hypothetical protein